MASDANGNGSRPNVIASWTQPVSFCIAVGCEILWPGKVLGGVPLCCNHWSLCWQRVVLAHFVPTAEWAALAPIPILHCGKPDMRVAIWTLTTSPLSLLVAEWFDDDVAQVSIGSMVPLLLKLRTQLADVWFALLFCWLSSCMSACIALHTSLRTCRQTNCCQYRGLAHLPNTVRQGAPP